MTNTGKKYHDRHTDKRRVVYWLRRNMDKLTNVLKNLEVKK